MKKAEIIGKLAGERMVEGLLQKHSQFANNPYIDDLAQDIYIILLDEEDSLIERLYEDGSIAFYVQRIIRNNLYSTTSEFWYRYQRFRKKSNTLTYNEQQD